MARADLLLKLVKASTQRNHEQVRRVIEAMAAEERAKNHTILAERLLTQLQGGGNGHTLSTTRTLRAPAGPLLAEIIPQRCLGDLFLPPDVEEVVSELVAEQHRADLLRSYSLEPRHRVLLAGPPGNGKTTLAEALAHALCVPMLVVRYEAVIGSYLGETAQRIARVFEEARSRHCVLFFDEFDAVGKERGDQHETGEIKRVVSSLLLQIDALPSFVVAVTATNHPELLDRAIWRRFQVCVELPAPKRGQIEKWFRRFAEQHDYTLDISPRSLAQRLQGLSFAEIEEFGNDVLRRAVLDQPNADVKAIVASRLRHWKGRFKPEQAGLGENHS
ncbi:MAG: AAA family ATPase [Synechococcus sp. SB0678_bin_12]|nr:AAA family ATPase [Synechococcus sp. SB0678_bin_12]MYI87683.1 AAA family ATPase [Synechococcus sp. SB0672_bin_10]